MLCPGGALASHLKPKKYLNGVFWGALPLCHFGAKVEVIVGTDQVCSLCTTLWPFSWNGWGQCALWPRAHWGSRLVKVPGLCTALCIQDGGRV